MLKTCRIIVIGKQRAGKDTFALNIAKYGFRNYALANVLKEIVYEKRFEKCYELGVDETIIKNMCSAEDVSPKKRKTLIAVGEYIRNVNPYAFIQHLLCYTDLMSQPRAVITDVRFKNEYNTFLNLGFIPVRIEATYESRSKRKDFDPESEKSKSETDLDDFPFALVIRNDETLEEFRARSESAVKIVGGLS